VLPADQRLTDPAAFARTVRSGRRAGSPRLVVHLDSVSDPVAEASRPGAAPRVGLVVSKAVGNAVVRNRVKRRLRHQACLEVAGLPAGSALVIRALPASAVATSAELGQELHRLIDRCQGVR
jgi:ribonuclease P protein component